MIIDVWHNLLWSRYKAVVFTQLHREAAARGVQVNFFQIAEPASARVERTAAARIRSRAFCGCSSVRKSRRFRSEKRVGRPGFFKASF